MSTKIELAIQYRERGYGCAQTVLATFAQDYGLTETRFSIFPMPSITTSTISPF